MTFSYILTKENLPPKKLSRDGFIDCHSSFSFLLSKNDNYTNLPNKRKSLTDIAISTNMFKSSSTLSSILVLPDKKINRIQVINEIF